MARNANTFTNSPRQASPGKRKRNSGATINNEIICSCIGDAVAGLAIEAVLQRINGATVEQVLIAAVALLGEQEWRIAGLEDELERKDAELYREIGDLRAHLVSVSDRLSRLPDHSNSSGGSAP